jgi:arylsulfatase A-like enzyme
MSANDLNAAAQRIGTTVAESTPHWPAPQHAAGVAPNVLLVIFDDTGWSDFGCFGSEIATPAIDALAAEGLRYANFHVTPLCSPTRACVLTGRNHHAIGMRFLSDTDTGFPNSRGRIRADVPTLPGLLREQGYGTYLVGKWHLTPGHEITPAGPFRDWPLGRGFDKFYGFLEGVADHYAPQLIQDNHHITPHVDEHYHLSIDLVDRALHFLRDHATYHANERPFFLQLAFGATHAPFQAPRSLIEPYVDVFAKGWDRTREDRLARQKALGLVPPETQLAPRNPGVAAWDQLDGDARRLYSHLQAAFAGFLEHADRELGRLVVGLRELGLRDDTIVIVMSDNGASREGGQHGAIDINGPYSGHRPGVAEQLANLDLIGGPHGPAHYPEGWAMAGNTPFQRYKQFTDLGGVRSPLVVSWPRGIEACGEVRQQFVHAIDIAPTILSLLEQAPTAMDGASIVATFADPAAPTRRTQYWETLGHRAIWSDGWKAVTTHEAGSTFDDDRWRLYHVAQDFAEATDLAAAFPGKLDELKALWWNEARANDVLPLDERTLVQLIELKTPLGLHNRSRIVLRPGQSVMPAATRLTGSCRPMQVHASLRNHRGEHQGVLLASGSAVGGYSFYVRDGTLHFEHVSLGHRTLCRAECAVPFGAVRVGFRIRPGGGKASLVELLHSDAVVGSAPIPRTSNHLSFWGLSICADLVSQVSRDYGADFSFPSHALEDVVIELDDESAAADLATVILATE